MAVSSDLEACAQLISNHKGGVLTDWISRFWADLANPGRHFLVATIDGSVVGYGHTVLHVRSPGARVDSGPPGYFLSGLLTAPGQRRKGIGTLLTIARIDELRRVTDTIYFRTEPGNRASIDLHSRLGFTQVGTVQREGREFSLFKLELDSRG